MTDTFDPKSSTTSSIPLNLGLLLMLSALTALAPFGTDVYLSAIPVMAQDFSVAVHDVEISISYFLVGLSLGQLLGGPLSDRYGRRKLVITGLGLFALSSVVIVFSDSLMMLWVMRFFQALGGGLAMVNSSAIIRDLSSGKEGAANLIRVMQVMMVAPLVAPIIGMLILQVSNWNSIFAFLAVYALLLMALFYRYLPETSPMSVNGNLLKSYFNVIAERKVWGFITSTCAAYAGLLSFITASPGVLMGYFQLSETVYPFVFGFNVLAMVLMSRVNLRLLSHFHSRQLIALGQGLQLLSSSLMVAYILLFDQHTLFVLIPLTMLFMGSHSFVVANSISCTTELFPERAGTATALIAALGFFSGGLAGGIVGHFADGTPLPMVLMLLSACLLGIGIRGLNAITLRTVASNR
ncbi:multidrug effflux MFS transporter [Oceanospirillum maris]|jgi:DHA1 family bicyclomycin/chloramphenicol resistance-like MFS transporter|uniref:multidrug effflux MFS transporter n=1 Tax=Oceanospirillum maris TaxID=64977 RepID=UPI0003FF96E4|nr:multidrug effflux MFS transporter [Oceanospirillum maris]